MGFMGTLWWVGEERHCSTRVPAGRLMQPGDYCHIYSTRSLNFLCGLIIEAEGLICLFSSFKRESTAPFWWRSQGMKKGLWRQYLAAKCEA